jgi:hypothetical protein
MINGARRTAHGARATAHGKENSRRSAKERKLIAHGSKVKGKGAKGQRCKDAKGPRLNYLTFRASIMSKLAHKPEGRGKKSEVRGTASRSFNRAGESRLP